MIPMTPLITQIAIAVAMLALTAAMFVWIWLGLRAARARRLTWMIERVGLDAGVAGDAYPVVVPAIKRARLRCARCRSEALCERWLDGRAAGENVFCPNARLFRSLLEVNQLAA